MQLAQRQQICAHEMPLGFNCFEKQTGHPTNFALILGLNQVGNQKRTCKRAAPRKGILLVQQPASADDGSCKLAHRRRPRPDPRSWRIAAVIRHGVAAIADVKPTASLHMLSVLLDWPNQAQTPTCSASGPLQNSRCTRSLSSFRPTAGSSPVAALQPSTAAQWLHSASALSLGTTGPDAGPAGRATQGKAYQHVEKRALARSVMRISRHAWVPVCWHAAQDRLPAARIAGCA